MLKFHELEIGTKFHFGCESEWHVKISDDACMSQYGDIDIPFSPTQNVQIYLEEGVTYCTLLQREHVCDCCGVVPVAEEFDYCDNCAEDITVYLFKQWGKLEQPKYHKLLERWNELVRRGNEIRYGLGQSEIEV